MTGKANSNARQTHHLLQRIEVSVGQCVLVNPEDQGLEYVGRIVNKKGDKITLQWFYRPEDTVSGRKPWNGQHELFRSTHTDTVDIGTIKCICNVMTLREYLEKQVLEEHDFFWRFTYVPMTNGGKFEDEATVTYCTCNTPYNPDLTMLYCASCRNWYHQSCLFLDDEEVQAAECNGFECAACKEKAHAQGPTVATASQLLQQEGAQRVIAG